MTTLNRIDPFDGYERERSLRPQCYESLVEFIDRTVCNRWWDNRKSKYAEYPDAQTPFYAFIEPSWVFAPYIPSKIPFILKI